MKNNSPQNFICEFAAETVDFIYGEMNDARKHSFQAHLKNCSECADEVRDFSDVIFSIRDWKASAFDSLETPPIQIPYTEKQISVATAENKRSWLDSLGNYFRFSPILSGAAAVAILVFLAVLVFVTVKNDDAQMVAETNTMPINTPAPVNDKQKSSANKNQETAKVAESEKNKAKEKPVTNESGDAKNEIKKSVSAKANEKVLSEPKPQTIRSTEKKSSVTQNSNVQKNVQTKSKPRLNDLPEEDEDDGLRLTDMFAELDTRE